MFTRALAFVAALAFFGLPSATAAEYYVDAVHGSNANTGTSPAQAWLTISHALAVVPGGGFHTIHVAPGLYDSALGESFALPLRHQIALVGDGGSGLTVVDASGGSGFVGINDDFGSTIASSIRGLTVRNGSYGFWMLVQREGAGLNLALEDVVIENTTAAAIYGEIWYPGAVFTGAGLGVTLERVRIHGCGSGIGLYDFEAHGDLALQADDCDLSGNAGTGVDFLRGSSTSATFSLQRCRIVGNGGHGVALEQSSGASTSATIASSLIAQNGGDGVRGTAPGASIGFGAIQLCTIAGNAASGVGIPVAGGLHFGLENCILYGNGDDIAAPLGSLTARFCDIGDGDFAGLDGNFSADPLFRSAAAADYRLSWASPCVDGGDPTTAAGLPDLAGTVRHVDGDLDTLERVDVGALEFRPLDQASVARIGLPLELELWGEVGGSARLYMGRGFQQPTPSATPFGDFDLDPGVFRSLGATPIAPGPPALRLLPIPNLPSYIGLTFSFQALSRSGLAPQGAAHTNPLSVTIAP